MNRYNVIRARRRAMRDTIIDAPAHRAKPAVNPRRVAVSTFATATVRIGSRRFESRHPLFVALAWALGRILARLGA